MTIYDYNGNILQDVLRVREALIKYGFWDQTTVDRFITLFQQFVECLKCDYDPNTFTIRIKKKKTAVKKIPNYRPEVYFYYSILGSVMMLILKENKERVIRCLQNYIQNCPSLEGKSVYDIYFTMITNTTYLYNLANVQCIMDNLVQVIL